MKGSILLLCGFFILSPLYLQAKEALQDTSSLEWIKVYFNQPADHSVALPGNMSKSNADLMGTLESFIEEASHSINLAIYDLEHPRIGNAVGNGGKAGRAGSSGYG